MRNTLLKTLILAICFAGLQSCSKSEPGDVKQNPEPEKPTDTVAASTILAELFKNSYAVYEMQRNSKGIYRDSKLFTGTDYHPASVANIGIGLISLCIADKMNWITDADQKVIVTLKSLLGKDPSFKMDVNAAGFPRHFIDMESGAKAWDSEYSTVDAALMVSGALFCKKYFSANSTIGALADELYKSIDWPRAVADPSTGKLYLSLDADGNGQGITSAYNEYMLLAHLAYKSENGMGGKATDLWNNFYADPTKLPQSDYWGIKVLTDNPGSFLSDFIPQFCYYLCHSYTTNSQYISFMNNAMLADKKWWTYTPGLSSYEWGLGAGSAVNGYHADRINENSDKIVSPHIIAGFIPINQEGSKNDLYKLYKANKGVYTLPGTTKKILWRYSVSNTFWRANEVQGIDFSSMLFGLAALPENCGVDFFSTNNNYQFPVYSFEPK